MSADASATACPLSRKLARFVALSGDELALLERLTAPDEAIGADADIVREGQVPRAAFVLREGMAVRYRVLPDGGRQILTFIIPGDALDVHCLLQRRMDHSIATISPARVCAIAFADLADALSGYAALAAAWQWSALQEAAMLRERVVALGRRHAHGRVAYLLCELLWRHEAIGTAIDRTLPWTLTQTELGDTLGLTAVSINRVLKDFRGGGLITMTPGALRVLDVAALQREAGLSREYLRPGPEPGQSTRNADARRSGDGTVSLLSPVICGAVPQAGTVVA